VHDTSQARSPKLLERQKRKSVTHVDAILTGERRYSFPSS
jgi:hypothetical protein